MKSELINLHFVYSVAVAALLPGFAVVLWVLGDSATAMLAFDRDSILDGQWWRLLTGHWVHLNGTHLALNVGAFLVIFLIFWRDLTPLNWLFASLFIATGSSLSLLIVHPQIDWYMGLSGLLHGLPVFAALAPKQRYPHTGLIVLALITAKLVIEHVFSSGLYFDDVIGGPVLTIAHVHGALWGTLLAFAIRAYNLHQSKNQRL